MNGTGILVILVIIAVGAWWIDLRIHPIRRCPSCGGSKRNATNAKRWGPCRRCGGKGEIQRFGARSTGNSGNAGNAGKK